MIGMVRLESLLDTWKTIRMDAAQAVEDMPEAGLDFRPQEDLMSFREIAVHILQAGRGLTGVVLDGEENLATPDFRQKLQKYFWNLPDGAGAREIAGALREAVEEHRAALADRPPEFFAQILTRMDGLAVTRLEMMQFVKEHELTHRAQMFLYLRLNGVVPPTTRRRLAQKR
jgi:uncharacterized damage-inducible protein DinB